MEVGVLGPLTVTTDGREVAVGPAKQQALLAALVLRRDRVVPVDTLLDDLWGDDPPPTAIKNIQGYISHLRKILDGGGLETRPSGYRFAARSATIDADCFEMLLRRGLAELTHGRPDAAAEHLRAALALWRGPPLAEFHFHGDLANELGRLRELRLLALESRLEAEVAGRNPAAAVPELRALVRENPLRESLAASLMLALYRAGRQADALAVYTDIREALVDELGVEPGESLQRLQAQILQHDPALEPTEARSAGPASPSPALARVRARTTESPPAPASGAGTSEQDTPTTTAAIARPTAIERVAPASIRRRRRWIRRPVTTAACIALLATAAFGLVNAQGPRAVEAGGVDSVAFVDSGTGRITTEVPLSGSPTALAGDGTDLWAVEPAARAVARIDTTRGSVVQTVPVGNDPSAVVVAGGSIWVANHDDGTVSRISPEMNEVVQTVTVGTGPLALAAGSGSVWVTNSDDRTVSRIDARSGRTVGTIHTNTSGRGVVVDAAGAVWVTDEAKGQIVKIDPLTDAVDGVVADGDGPTAIAQAGGDLWVVNSLAGTVSRIDPATEAVTLTLPISRGATTIGGADGVVWVGSESGSAVTRIDIARGTIATTTTWAARPEAVWATGSGAWVSGQAQGSGHRGGRLVVASSVDTIDPSAADTLPEWIGLAYDALTMKRATGGSAGTQIVPDLALSLPEPTDGGRTYTFHLRPGVRYSNGNPLQPGDFRLGLERLLLLNPGLAGAFSHVVGATTCITAASCDLSSGVTFSGASTVAFHLTSPDPSFLDDLSMLPPTPQGTPLTDTGTTPIPSTGPYAISDYEPGRLLTFDRNRYFRVADGGRPDGYPDEILFRLDLSDEEAATKIADGQVDLVELVSEPPAAQQLRLAHPGEVHSEDRQATVSAFLNVTAPPFDDVRVRRALDFAIDRELAVQQVGADLARPTCQTLAPTTTGYRAYCPYTVDPGSDGQWRAPDLATARSLVAASGTAGQSVTVWTFSDFADAGEEVAETLDELGYRAKVHEIADADTYFAALSANPTVQAGIVGWYDSPLAIDALSIFTCGFKDDRAQFCNPAIDAEIERLSEIEPADPASPGALELAARIDREITDQAALVPLFNPQFLVLTSARVGNYQSERGNLLIDQLWVQ